MVSTQRCTGGGRKERDGGTYVTTSFTPPSWAAGMRCLPASKAPLQPQDLSRTAEPLRRDSSLAGQTSGWDECLQPPLTVSCILTSLAEHLLRAGVFILCAVQMSPTSIFIQIYPKGITLELPAFSPIRGNWGSVGCGRIHIHI